jgi:hypothetical protein
MEQTPIKAVEMVRRIRDRMYEETRDMSPDEFQAFIAREAARTIDRRPAEQSPHGRSAA